MIQDYDSWLNEQDSYTLEDIAGDIVTWLEDQGVAGVSFEKNTDGSVTIDVGGDTNTITQKGEGYTMSSDYNDDIEFPSQDELISWWMSYAPQYKHGEAEYRLGEAKIVLDTVLGEDPGWDEDFFEYLRSKGITHKQIGKVNGWPEVEYVGSPEALVDMAKTHFELADDEIEELMTEGKLLDIFEKDEKAQSLSAINEEESSDADYEKWKEALKLYNDHKNHTPAQDAAFTQLFRGSKVTARFIYRSISSNSRGNYDKDCKEFGKAKVDNIVDQVLKIKS